MDYPDYVLNAAEPAERSLTEGPRKCSRCFVPVEREVYFRNHFYCESCAEHDRDFPLQTTHGTEKTS